MNLARAHTKIDADNTKLMNLILAMKSKAKEEDIVLRQLQDDHSALRSSEETLQTEFDELQKLATQDQKNLSKLEKEKLTLREEIVRFKKSDDTLRTLSVISHKEYTAHSDFEIYGDFAQSDKGAPCYCGERQSFNSQ